jgi:hypothetical protein
MTIATPQLLASVRSYNEAEVRFHVIDPILRALGYPGDDDVYLKLEEQLSYPYYHIGRKSKKRDLPLGFPDYRAGLKGDRGSFIVEAKAATAGTTEADIEQAHSYAAHAQVGANYFVLCDGMKVAVFETLQGPTKHPIVDISISQIDARFHELENILSPQSLAKNCRVAYDRGLKLCEGLSSAVKIHSGEYGLDHWSYRIFVNDIDATELLKRSLPQLGEVDRQMEMLQNDFELRVSAGSVFRDESGRIQGQVNFSGVTKNSDAGMKLLGVDRMAFSTSYQFLSLDPNNQTKFESNSDFSLEKGSLIAPLFGAAVASNVQVNGDVLVSARMYKKDDYFLGDYGALANYRSNTPFGQMNVELILSGPFTLKIQL